MFIREMEESSVLRLVKILNHLKESYQVSLSFENRSQSDLHEIYENLHDERVQIKESTEFNTYHEDDSYIINGLVMEAIKLFIESVESLDTHFDS